MNMICLCLAFCRVSGSDVLGTVPVIGFHVNHKHSLDDRLVPWHLDPMNRWRSILAIKDVHTPKDLEPSLLWVINQDHRHTVIGQQISSADELLIASEVGECERLIIYDLEKSFGTAAVLNIWPIRQTDCGPVKAVAPG